MQLSGSHQAVIRQSSGSYNFVRQSKKSLAQAWTVQWQSSGSHQAVVMQLEKLRGTLENSEKRFETLGNSDFLWSNHAVVWKSSGSHKAVVRQF